jgi:hypothetical protein
MKEVIRVLVSATTFVSADSSGSAAPKRCFQAAATLQENVT